MSANPKPNLFAIRRRRRAMSLERAFARVRKLSASLRLGGEKSPGTKPQRREGAKETQP